jgi:tripartite-type tricarboxylate transporter receptor subunit TctC
MALFESVLTMAAAADLPMIVESGVAGFDVNPWFGGPSPASTPMSIVRQINAEIAPREASLS